MSTTFFKKKKKKKKLKKKLTSEKKCVIMITVNNESCSTLNNIEKGWSTMEIVVVKREAYSITNEKLLRATERIAKLSEAIMSNYAKIGKILSEVKDNKLYVSDFATFANWVETAFNMSLNTANRIIRVTQTLMIPDIEDGYFNGFADTALAALTTIGDYEQVVAFCDENNIDETTSVREITKIVSEHKPRKQREKNDESVTGDCDKPRDYIAEAVEDYKNYLLTLRDDNPDEFTRIMSLVEKKCIIMYDISADSLDK